MCALERAERRERIPIPCTAGLRDVDRDRDVLGAGAVVVAEPLGLLHDRDDIREGAGLLPRRVRARQQREHRRDDAEFHLVTPW